MERNGCWYRRRRHWRFPLLTLVITWTTVPVIIPWIDIGRCVADIYEYVDTDFYDEIFSHVGCTCYGSEPSHV